MRRTALNTTLVLGSLIFSLFALEVTARLLDLGDETIAVHRLQAVSPENRLRFIENSDAVVETPEYSYVQRANSYGRRDIDWSREMILDPCNIIFVGDSFVMGFGVADEWTVPTLLERLYARGEECVAQVFNFGMGGAVSTPEYEQLLASAMEIGIAARTVVVGVFLGNDFSMRPVVVPNGDSEHMANAAPAAGYFELSNSELLRFVLDRVKYSARLTGFFLKIGGILGIETYVSPDAYIFRREYSDEERTYFEDTLGVLLEMREMAAKNGKGFYVVVFPNKVQVENFLQLKSSVYDTERPNRLIREFCDMNDLPCLDLLPALRHHYNSHGTPLYYPIDRHLNEVGSEVAARKIYEFLEKQRIWE
jgi:hypothetical protein